jgi:DNA-binding LacI/PurR family transcriptional regulator
MPQAIITLRDVARAAGVSPAAVSLALRGEGTLSAATRAHIHQVAQKLKYRRNVFAASLRTRNPEGSGHGMPLALIIHHTNDGDYPIVSLRRGLREEGTRLGYLMEEVHLQPGEPLRPILRTLYHRGVQGLFIGHTLEASAAPTEDWNRFCVVACNRGTFTPVFHTVRASAFDVVIQAMHILHDRGYRRVGAALFRHEPPILDDTNREAAYLWAQKHWGMDPLEPFLGSHTDQAGYLAWVRKVKPEAVLGFHVGCWYWLQTSGHPALKKIAYCCLHLENNASTLGIAGFYTPDVEIGHAAVVLMDSLIRHHDRGLPREVRESLLKRSLRDGRTLPLAAGRKTPAGRKTRPTTNL